jgi:hypothetical protein
MVLQEAQVQKLSSLSVVLTILTVAAMGIGSLADENRLTSDTLFMAIDLTYVTIGGAADAEPGMETEKMARPCGVEPSPFIIWRKGILRLDYYGWIMTLDAATGAQKGDRLEIAFPIGYVPADVLWAEHFLAPLARGVGPSPFVVFRDYLIHIYTITYGPDGTPSAGPPDILHPAIDPAVYGYATCIEEIPGSEFADGKSRLYIGTDNGHLVVLVRGEVGADVVVDSIYAIAANRIDDVEPVPQYGYISLGVLVNGVIHGYDPETANGIAEIFSVLNPPPSIMASFDIFWPDDQPLADPGAEVRLIMADGTTNLALASFSSSQTGSWTLTRTFDPHDFAVKSVAIGSLMTLANDGSLVTYDPDYSEESGSSGCEVTITDGEADMCGYTCGDANGDGFVNVGDAVFLINYVFKGGSPPNPVCAGDANGDGGTNVGDAVYLINFVFKAGPGPAANCCQ